MSPAATAEGPIILDITAAGSGTSRLVDPAPKSKSSKAAKPAASKASTTKAAAKTSGSRSTASKTTASKTAAAKSTAKAKAATTTVADKGGSGDADIDLVAEGDEGTAMVL
jgi:hypothetical protein